MLLILGATTYLFLNFIDVHVLTSFDELLPQKHPYIKLHKEVRDKFGGANVVTISLEVKEGDIFNPKTLEKIKYLTEQIDLIPGINHYQVESIAHPKVRSLAITPEGMMNSYPVMPDTIPKTPEELAQFKRDCFVNDTVRGRLVSYDGKAALVSAAFYEQRLNYAVVFERLQKLRKELTDDNTTLYITGSPMLYGWIYYHYRYTTQLYRGCSIIVVLGITLFVLFSLLLFYFRRIVGVLVPFVGAGISCIWGVGFAGIAGYNFDPLILIVHLLVTARCISHSVQMTERFLEEYEETGDKKYSAKKAMADLFVPGMISVVTDAMGIFVVSVSSIPMMHRLAFFNTFWGTSIIFSVLMLTPILISLMPAPRKRERYVVTPVHNYLIKMGQIATGPKSRWIVLGTAILIFAIVFPASYHITYGDTRPGSPLLWSEHDYNVSARAINRKFAGANHLYIIFTGDKENALKDPNNLRMMEAMGEYLVEDPKAGDEYSIATLMKSINKMYHYEDPLWSTFPDTSEDVGGLMFMYEAGSPVPRVLSSYIDYQGKEANLAVYYKDTTGPTISNALERANEFIAQHPTKGFKYRLAGGLIGVLAATNEDIEWSDHWNNILVFSMVFFCVFVSYFSVVASCLIVAPLGLATLIALAYMAWQNIGMNINTLPVAAIGVGVGVDYAVYIVDRMRKEYWAMGGDIDAAIRKAISTTGMAVTFTAVCLVAGILFWYPLSSIRFMAEMALLLSIVLTANGIFAVTLVPSLFSIIKPRFALEEKDPSTARRRRIRRIFLTILIVIVAMGSISLYALSTGHRNIDTYFFTVLGGLSIAMMVHGVVVQLVE
jgi:hypothetical protein